MPDRLPGAPRVIVGDALVALGSLETGLVQCCVTSPPYFGLRDYGTGEWEGGEADCDHLHKTGGTAASTLGAASGGNDMTDAARRRSTERSYVAYAGECGKCGATRVDRQIGLESTPDEYVARLVEVFAEVKRVLRDDGTLWLNLGDSYCSTDKWGGGKSGNNGKHTMSGDDVPSWAVRERSPSIPGVKPKDLLGIPWMVAFALRADGWVLRQEVIWQKPNPMPESVTDRCTKAHEQVFMFSKARWTGAEEPLPMRDVDAAWLAALIDGEGSICFQDRTSKGASQRSYSVRLSICNTNRALLERVTEICGLAGVSAPSPRTRSTGESGRPVYAWQVTNAKAAKVLAAVRPYLIAKGTQADLGIYVQSLNRKHTGRGGYTVSAADQDAKAKAATACSALNRGEPVDLAWFTPAKVGRWVPMPYAYDADAIREGAVGQNHHDLTGTARRDIPGQADHSGNRNGGPVESNRNKRSVWTVATQPYPEAHFATFPAKLIEPMILAGCPRGGTVLDPFAGSGTTLQVALANGRDAIGIELNPEYMKLIERRLAGVTPSMFDAA